MSYAFSKELTTLILKDDVVAIGKFLETYQGKSFLKSGDELLKRTPLHIACGYKDVSAKVINLILEYGVNVNHRDDNNHTALERACYISGNMEAIETISKMTKLSNSEQVLVAVCTGNMSLFREFANYTNDYPDLATGITHLRLACKYGQREAVEYRLTHGAVVNPAMEPDTIEDGIDDYNNPIFVPNPKKPKHYSTAMHDACKNGNMEIIELLVKWGADLNAYDDIETPLHIAVSRNDVRLTRYILDRVHQSAVHDLTKDKNEAPIHKAAQCRNVEMIDLLLSKGANINCATGQTPSPLHSASAYGDVEFLKSLLQRGAVISENNDGETLLHEACKGGSLEVAKYLLSNRNININSKSKKQETPLLIAAGSGRRELIEYLCETKADVNVANKDGSTPLHIACMRKNTAATEVLLAYGASVNAKDKSHKTPFYIACEMGSEKLVSSLIKHKADINVADKEGTAPIHVVCSHLNRALILKLLLENAVNVNAKNKHGFTPLHLATKIGDKEVVKLLMEQAAPTKGGSAGVDVTLKDGDTPLFIACGNKDLTTAKLLIESGASIHTPNKYGKTILMVIASHKLLDFANYLIKCGADVNAVQTDGITAVSIAAKNNDKDMTELLLKNNAYPNTPDHEGKTPLFHACVRDYKTVAELLANHGATFGDMADKPTPSSYYGHIKNLKDAKATSAGKAARKIIKAKNPKNHTGGNSLCKASVLSLSYHNMFWIILLSFRLC